VNLDRIKKIQKETAYPESQSVKQALLKVWNETQQEIKNCEDCIHEDPIDVEEAVYWCSKCIYNNESEDNYEPII